MLVHAVDNHTEALLLLSASWKSVRRLCYILILRPAKKNEGLTISCATARILKNPTEGVCLCSARFSSLPGARSDSQSLGSRACQL